MQVIIPGILVSLACTCLAQIRPFAYELRGGAADLPAPSNANNIQTTLNMIQSRMDPVQSRIDSVQPVLKRTDNIQTRIETLQPRMESLSTLQNSNIQPINSQGGNIFIEPSQGMPQF